MDVTVNHAESVEPQIRMLAFCQSSEFHPSKRIISDSVSQSARNTKPCNTRVLNSFDVRFNESMEVSFFGLWDVEPIHPWEFIIPFIEERDCCMPSLFP